MEINEYWGALCLLFKNQGVLAEQGSLLVLEQMINERPSILPMQQWENDFWEKQNGKEFHFPKHIYKSWNTKVVQI